MILLAYAQTLWLDTMPQVEESYAGLFAGRQLSGRAWLAQLPAEDRIAFSRLGHRACSLRGINWHAAGGRHRAKYAHRDWKGRYLPGIPF